MTLYPPLAQLSPDELLMKGFTVFDIRLGSSPKFTFDEMIEDGKYVIAFIKKHANNYNIKSDKIGLWGASFGGYW